MNSEYIVGYHGCSIELKGFRTFTLFGIFYLGVSYLVISHVLSEAEYRGFRFSRVFL
jgi:hypothetical protein